MKLLLITPLFLVLSFPASAICVLPTDHSLEQVLKQAQTVFVATITKSQLDPDYRELIKDQKRSRDRPWYTVRYEFEVAIPIKGNPSSIPYLTTGGVYNDPKTKSNRVFGEQSRFVPGDNILVVTSGAGPAPISWLNGCTDSMPWNGEARDLLKRSGLLGAP